MGYLEMAKRERDTGCSGKQPTVGPQGLGGTAGQPILKLPPEKATTNIGCAVPRSTAGGDAACAARPTLARLRARTRLKVRFTMDRDKTAPEVHRVCVRGPCISPRSS